MPAMELGSIHAMKANTGQGHGRAANARVFTLLSNVGGHVHSCCWRGWRWYINSLLAVLSCDEVKLRWRLEHLSGCCCSVVVVCPSHIPHVLHILQVQVSHSGGSCSWKRWDMSLLCIRGPQASALVEALHLRCTGHPSGSLFIHDILVVSVLCWLSRANPRGVRGCYGTEPLAAVLWTKPLFLCLVMCEGY